MISGVPSRTSPEFLAREVERTFFDYRFAWEGEQEEIREMGDATIRILPTPVYGWSVLIENPRIDAAVADSRIEALESEARRSGSMVRWVFGDNPGPRDLAQRLEARGYTRGIHWDGLALTDLSVGFPISPDVRIEALSEENLADYVDVGEIKSEEDREARRAAARRFLQIEKPEAIPILGRIDGAVASAVVLRIEPNGVAYLRNAMTHPDFRKRGVYMTLIAERLRVAREAGCDVAVVQAQTHSSSPTLRKRGFQRVCGFYAYSEPRETE